jgi:ubiquinone/menaquinone biosynthesis C-methylase UbiE
VKTWNLLKHILTRSKATVGLSNEANWNAWIAAQLRKLPKKNRLLDAGAGEQQYKKFADHLNYVSQDFAQYDGHGNKEGLQTGAWKNSDHNIISDITAIPEPNESFDAVLCTEVFEHLPNPPLALKEFARLLRPGGKLIMTVPFCSLTHFAPYHFYTGFNRYFFDHFFKELGLKLDELTYSGNYFEYLAQEIRRLPSMAELYSSGVAFSPVEKKAQSVLLRTLQDLAEHNKSSETLLSYGLHVVASK